MTETDFDPIRQRTRIALPDDDAYLYRLGVAVYGFSSVTSSMCEVIGLLDASVDRSAVEDQMAGRVLRAFKKATEEWVGMPILSAAATAASEFARLSDERSDFVHAYPITSETGAQILHRRKDSRAKYFKVTNEFLDDFVGRLSLVSDALYEIRAAVS